MTLAVVDVRGMRRHPSHQHPSQQPRQQPQPQPEPASQHIRRRICFDASCAKVAGDSLPFAKSLMRQTRAQDLLRWPFLRLLEDGPCPALAPCASPCSPPPAAVQQQQQQQQ